jgi:hypothetical protein
MKYRFSTHIARNAAYAPRRARYRVPKSTIPYHFLAPNFPDFWGYKRIMELVKAEIDWTSRWVEETRNTYRHWMDKYLHEWTP